jgi:hypothetical protein
MNLHSLFRENLKFREVFFRLSAQKHDIPIKNYRDTVTFVHVLQSEQEEYLLKYGEISNFLCNEFVALRSNCPFSGAGRTDFGKEYGRYRGHHMSSGAERDSVVVGRLETGKSYFETDLSHLLGFIPRVTTGRACAICAGSELCNMVILQGGGEATYITHEAYVPVIQSSGQEAL